VTRVSYRLLADLTVALHGAFILFVVAGGFLAWRWRWVAWVHVPCACWGALVELGGWVCPLTPLENALRLRAGEAGYGGGFIEHYIVPTLYPTGLTRAQQVLLGGAVLAVNVLAYGLLIRRGAPSR
jgi:Protein of Unknown function (DUF2784)